MIPEEHKQAWALLLLETVKRSDQEGPFDVFIDLVDQARGSCDLFVCKGLLATYTDAIEDCGQGESVCSVMAGAEHAVRIQALLEELPRLRKEATEWTPCLVSQEARFHREALLSVAAEINPALRDELLEVLCELSAEEVEKGREDIYEPLVVAIRAAASVADVG